MDQRHREGTHGFIAENLAPCSCGAKALVAAVIEADVPLYYVRCSKADKKHLCLDGTGLYKIGGEAACEWQSRWRTGEPPESQKALEILTAGGQTLSVRRNVAGVLWNKVGTAYYACDRENASYRIIAWRPEQGQIYDVPFGVEG
jgi:hypothetical protein